MGGELRGDVRHARGCFCLPVHSEEFESATFPDGIRNPAFLDEVAAASADKSAPVVFLCRSGVRSVAAAEAATAAGYTAAYNILEGFEGPPDEQSHRGRTAGWKARGLPWKQG